MKNTEIRWDKCGTIVGEMIPTGETENGIPKVHAELFDNCVEVIIGMGTHYRCRDCLKEGEKAK